MQNGLVAEKALHSTEDKGSGLALHQEFWSQLLNNVLAQPSG